MTSKDTSTGATEDGTAAKPTNGKAANGETANSAACEAGKITGTLDCKADIAQSIQATKIETCSADGKSRELSICSVNACASGYLLKENKCVPAACKPGSTPEMVSCTGEISNSAEATKSRTCNLTGTDYEFGECKVTGCSPGYFLAGNECKPMSCSPGIASSVSCLSAKPGSAEALQTRTCNEQGSDYILSDDCAVVSCASGYHKVGNSCNANTCEPMAALGDVSCVDESPGSSVATKTKSCNTQGSGYLFGTCSVSSCAEGYHKVGNSCVANICSPNAVDTLSCADEIPFSTAASKTRTCEGGASYTFGSCAATACSSGYSVSNNVCVMTYPALSAETGVSDQQVNLSLAAFPDGVSEVRLYRFTSQPPTSNWQCLSSSCTQIAIFKESNASMSGSFSLVDTAPAANTTYWYRYESVNGGQTRSDLRTATAKSSANTIAFRHSVFVTSATWKAGALGGLSGADAKCAAAAGTQSLSGTNYRAVIASNTQLAWERAQIVGPIKTLNGSLVAGTSRQLAHGYWTTADLTTEAGGSPVSTSTSFWLGDTQKNCGLWSAADSSSAIEDATQANTGWKGLTLNSSSGACNFSGFTTSRRLLCIGDH